MLPPSCLQDGSWSQHDVQEPRNEGAAVDRRRRLQSAAPSHVGRELGVLNVSKNLQKGSYRPPSPLFFRSGVLPPSAPEIVKNLWFSLGFRTFSLLDLFLSSYKSYHTHLRAKTGPRSPQDGPSRPNMTPRRPKIAPSRPKTVSRRPKTASRRPKMTATTLKKPLFSFGF